MTLITALCALLPQLSEYAAFHQNSLRQDIDPEPYATVSKYSQIR